MGDIACFSNKDINMTCSLSYCLKKIQRISHIIVQRMGDNEDVVNLSVKATEPIVRA